MGTREDTQVLNGLTVQAVGNLLGIKLPANGMARCPLPGHDDDTPSFEVRRQGRRWVCYGCDKAGGAIDLVMAYYGKPFLEAKSWLAEKSGLGSPTGRHMSRKLGANSGICRGNVHPIQTSSLRHRLTIPFTASFLDVRRFAKLVSTICEIVVSLKRHLPASLLARCLVSP